MVKFYSLFLNVIVVVLGKVTWHEYAALYVKFHHMNESDIKDLNDVDFIQESFDEDCKYFNFRRNDSIIDPISTTRTSENSITLDRS